MLKPYNKAEVTFDIIKEIGQDGRNSQAYICKDHQLDAIIVIKKMEKSKFSSLVNFFDESKCLYASSHPNVVQIHYACEDADSIYLAMPYYRNGSLKDLICNRFLSVREILVFGCQILSGLHNIHSKNLIHFDIKPDNILLSDRNEALVSDFGQSKQTNLSGVAAQDRLYSKMTPPEATQTDHFTYTFDIYQFGLTLYRMCVGNAAFEAQFSAFVTAGNLDRDGFRFALCNARFPDRTALPAHIPAALQKIIKCCLETDPKDRYPSANAVANAMASIDGAHLDWSYALTPNQRKWTKDVSGVQYEFIVDKDSKSTCYKTAQGGQRRRVVDACKDAMTEREVRKILGTY